MGKIILDMYAEKCADMGRLTLLLRFPFLPFTGLISLAEVLAEQAERGHRTGAMSAARSRIACRWWSVMEMTCGGG